MLEATPNRDQFSASPQEFRAELKLARHAAVHCTYSSRKQAAEVGVEGICVEALERKGIVVQHVEGFQAQLESGALAERKRLVQRSVHGQGVIHANLAAAIGGFARRIRRKNQEVISGRIRTTAIIHAVSFR